MKPLAKLLPIKHLLFFMLWIVISKSAIAQTVKPIESGKIVFERKQNMYKILNVLYAGENAAYFKNYVDDYKSKNPQFAITQFSIAFNNQKAVYQPLPNQTALPNFVTSCAYNNIVLTDLLNQTSQSQKNVLSTDFVLSDSVPKIKWRITNETREIAGFTCRRANALILDSVYVVAFYTDEIVAKSGPEAFAGLPGMILGVALPNEQVTWFATNYSPLLDNSLKNPPVLNGKKVTKTELLNLLKNNDQLQYQPKQAAFTLKRAMF